MNKVRLSILKIARTLTKPGGLAWLLAGMIACCGWLLCADPNGRLPAAALLSSAILALATARVWRARRGLVETALLLSGLMLTSIFMARAPEAWRIGLTPVVQTLAVLVVFTFGEWRFAPDSGQKGVHWAVAEASGKTLWASLGVVAGILLRIALAPEHAWQGTAITGLGALCGHAFGLLIKPHPNRTLIGPAEGGRRTTGKGHDDADWWKHVSH